MKLFMEVDITKGNSQKLIQGKSRLNISIKIFPHENDAAREKVVQQYYEISILGNYKKQLDKALRNIMYFD